MIKQEESIVKKLLPHLIAIICFLTITLIYFSPLLDGKVLPQSDVQQFQGVSHELSEYYKKEGQSSAWTGSLFSGMPAYMIGIWGGQTNFLDYLEAPMKALGSDSAGAVFAGMLMAYILFAVMGFGLVPSILGAIAYSLSSYNIIIIDAGHVTKAWAIAYMPLVVSGLLVMFKRKYLLGGLLLALGLALQIKNNHLQITYYTGILCVFIYIGFLIEKISEKDFTGLTKATGILSLSVAIAILCNLANFYANFEMSKESIRGKSELSQPTTTEKQSSGLDKEYAFKWSYGKMETFSLIIPNIYGGASGGKLDTSSNLYKVLKANGAQVDSDGVQSYTYWGDQPFTSGPVYFGAIICFLFILGMILVSNKMKWMLLAATIFFIFLSWGRNFEIFNDWFFYNFPYYNKFRAVSTALVIPALTMVFMAVWGLKEFFNKEIDNKNKLVALYVSAGITGGITLLFGLFPSSIGGLTFQSPMDSLWNTQMPEWYYNALLLDRKELLSADALRSFFYIAITALILWASTKIKTDKDKTAVYSSIFIILLIVTDLWNIDRRYLDTSKFVDKTIHSGQTFKQSIADKAILQDKSPSYRVFNLNNPFNDSGTSYYHKSIGGYHAAKLKRYQELIDYHLEPEMNTIIQSFNSQNIDTITASFANLKALNMLNMRYIIFHPEQPPLVNPHAYGNAWFVNNIQLVNNADEEIDLLRRINPRQTAIVDKRFESDIAGINVRPDSTSHIEMTSYKPNIVNYKAKVNSEQLAVFSEVYYDKGWKAFIDGKPASHIRTNWILRAMRIPAGDHQIEFRFEPDNYNMASMVTSVSSALLILIALGGGFLSYRKRK